MTNTADYECHVFSADMFQVTAGANLGDTIGPIDDLCLGDEYTFSLNAKANQLGIHDPSNILTEYGTSQPAKVADGSEIGVPGQPLLIDCRLTLMAKDGETAELLILRAQAPDAIFALPLTPIEPDAPYTLVTMSADVGPIRLGNLTSVAFTAGTMITLADGRQCPVEKLQPGDRVLTRDNGPQPLRWVGHRTLRALGPYAPVVISKGAFANQSDLIVSQHQRLFIYQPTTDQLLNTSELLVKAGNLVNDDDVFLRNGGYVAYYHLVFDRHEIIYAECIPTESLLINERTRKNLPDGVVALMDETVQNISHRPRFGLDASKEMLKAIGPDRLRKTPRNGG